MRGGDLSDLVLPLISVDEYESKIDKDKAIVIGFYVQDEEAAKDLNRFLQKCYVSLLDTDISPAPDQHGYYLVFVELMKNDVLGKNIQSILDDVSPLTNIKEWQMRIRKTKGVHDFSAKELVKAVERADKITENQKIVDFLLESSFDEVGFEYGNLVLKTTKSKQVFSVLGFGNTDFVLEKLMMDKASNVSLNEAVKANRLQSLLGENWIVSNFKDTFMIYKNDSEDCLVIRPFL